ncbi:IclR family transcriptional regulator [Afifella sp. YEN Y35]|uniref:IclR family transcriptional regulator n=1 Tax=Afifella sp. YEN Y35 TaxID=3388337 RepID=UPI0039DF3BD9
MATVENGVSDDAGQRGVEAVERAFRILACFDEGELTLTLAELARRTGLYKSTILRLCVSLERYGYIARQPDGRYRLGATVWRLGARYRQNFTAADLIRPELRRLAETIGETASFYVRDGDSRVCLYRHEPDRAIRHHIVEGARMPLTAGAASHLLLAWTEEDSRYREIRRAGHAVSLGERDSDIAAIAVPVFSPDGNLRGALAISGLITRFDDARRETVLLALKESAERIGRQKTAS